MPGRDRRTVRRDRGGARRLLDRRVSPASTGRPRSRPGCRHARPRTRPEHAPTPTSGRSSSTRDDLAGVTARRRPSARGPAAPLAPQVLGALVRRYGHFDTAEDAVQEALLAAAPQWPADGRAGQPARLADHRRLPPAHRPAPQRAGAPAPRGRRGRPRLPDEWQRARRRRRDPATPTTRSILLFLCCHPALSPASQIALTLRAVGGLTTAEIARAFLVPEATMARRITRAKQTIKRQRRAVPRCPRATSAASRLGAVLHVLYLIFNEGYAATAGPALHRVRAGRRGDPAGPAGPRACCPTTARSPACSP